MRRNVPIPNEWKNIDEETVALIITKRDGTKCKFIIDSKNYEWCKSNHYCVRSGYASVSGSSKVVLLHRLIAENAFGEIKSGFQVDHIDGDRTNNRESNLRICLPQDNRRNTKRRINSPTVIGVRKDKRCKNSWRAQIYLDKGKKIEKTYNDETLAILQRLLWEIIYFGEFAPQIGMIKESYPYLLNYLKVKDKMNFNTDISLIKEIGDSLLLDPHCPCSVVKNENTVCPCLPCRTKSHCHCSMFLPKTLE